MTTAVSTTKRPASSPDNGDPPLGDPAHGADRARRAPLRTVGRVLAVAAGCYLLLAVVLIGCGLIFTHTMAHSRIGHWDDHVNTWFAGHRDATENRISGDLTFLADTLGVVVLATIVTAILLVRRWGRQAFLLVVGLGVELAVFLSTTYLVARPRPMVPHLGGTPSTFSWPSGHTAATVVVFGGMAWLVTVATPAWLARVAAWTVAVLVTAGVAWSRVYRGEHHPTDVLAGIVLGIGALVAAVRALRNPTAAASR